MSVKIKNGNISVEVNVGKDYRTYESGVWYFCQNGYQSTGVNINFEQFEMLKRLITSPKVVEYYESEKIKQNEVIE